MQREFLERIAEEKIVGLCEVAIILDVAMANAGVIGCKDDYNQ